MILHSYVSLPEGTSLNANYRQQTLRENMSTNIIRLWFLTFKNPDKNISACRYRTLHDM
jgi:hypothetical protein